MVTFKTDDVRVYIPSMDSTGAVKRAEENDPLPNVFEPPSCSYFADCLAKLAVPTDFGGFPDPAPKDPNPKDSIGSSKIPFHLWPETASALGALALLDGALKYGRSNFRAAPVRASIYYDAARRHLAKWFEGEENDPDSGIPHLGHVLACLAILVDASEAGTLIDDRNYHGGYIGIVSRLTPHVKRLQELHADKTPIHYTIKENV